MSLYKQYREGEESGFLASFQTKTTVSAAVLLLFLIVYYYSIKFGFVQSLTLPESKMIIGLVICVPPFIFVSLISLSTKELEEGMHQLTEEEQKRVQNEHKRSKTRLYNHKRAPSTDDSTTRIVPTSSQTHMSKTSHLLPKYGSGHRIPPRNK